MASNNNDNGAMMGMALLGAVAFVAFAFVFALGVFLAFVLTGVCLRAWNRPVQLFGETLTPDDARAFVRRGVAGAVLVPAFALFCAGLFGVSINPDYWLYLPLGGYAFGALVVTYHIEKAKLEAAEQDAATRALPPPAPPAKPARTIDAAASSVTPNRNEREDAEPFRFATWDDEEELKR